MNSQNLLYNSGESDTLFSVNKTSRMLLLLFGMVGAVFYFVASGILVDVYCAAVVLGFALLRRSGEAIAAYTMFQLFVENSIVIAAILCILVCSILMRNQIIRLNKTTFFHIFMMLVLMALSFAFGRSPEINILILAIICLVLSIQVINALDERDYSMILYGFLLSAILMIVVLALKSASGENVLKFGRLSFDGSVRGVANACLIPIVFLVGAFFTGKRLFAWQSKGYYFFELALLFLVLMMTASRGVLLALAVNVATIFLFNSKDKYKLVKIFVIVVLFWLVFKYFSDKNIFRIDRLFVDKNGGLNGRTDIWMFYWNEIKKDGLVRVLFGFGPGDIKRIAAESMDVSMYSHSTFLDAFFSYGILGFLAYMAFFVKAGLKIMSSKNVILLSSFIALVVSYLSHGVVYNYQLYISTAILYALAMKNFGKEVRHDAK